MTSKASPAEESVLPLFKTMKERENEEKPGANQLLLEREPKLPDPLLVDSKGQCEPKTKWSLKELQASSTHFRQVLVNMINLTWADKGKGKATWEVKAERRPIDRPTKGVIKLPEKPKATIIKGVVLCSRCHSECELEVPTTGAILDRKLVKRKEKKEQERRMNIMWTNENETSQNVFQRLWGRLSA